MGLRPGAADPHLEGHGYGAVGAYGSDREHVHSGACHVK